MQGNLAANRDIGVDPIAEAPEEASLRSITQRIPIGVGPDVQSKAYRGGGAAPLLDADTAQLCPLDATELTTRDPHGRARGVLADAGAFPSQTDLAADLMVELPELPQTSIQPAISSSHATMVDARAHRPITWELAGSLRLA